MIWRKMLFDPDTQDFWKHDSLWPNVQDGYQFLGQAVLRVGHAMFQDGWHDMDVASSHGPSPIESFNLPHRLWHDDFPELSADEFRERALRHDAWWDEVHGPATRFRAVKEWITERCADGRLRTGLREYGGGEIVELSRSIWKTEPEMYKWWFARCQMSAADPYCEQKTGEDFKRIFVLKSDLDSAIAAWIGETLVAIPGDPAASSDEAAPLTPSKRRALLQNVETWLRARLDQSSEIKTHTLPELIAEAMMTFEKEGLNPRMIEREIWPKVRSDYPAWAKRGKMAASRSSREPDKSSLGNSADG